jgi:hypothetical protein
MERRLILMNVKKGALVARGTSGLGLVAADTLTDQGLTLPRFVRHSEPDEGPTEGLLLGMAEQVRLLSATVDSLLRRAESVSSARS